MYIGSCLICNLGCWGNDVLTVKIKVNKQRPKVQSFDRKKKKKKYIDKYRLRSWSFLIAPLTVLLYIGIFIYLSEKNYRWTFLHLFFLQAILLPKRTLKLSW